MKVLRNILLGILTLLVLLVVVSFFLPDAPPVERSTVIEAPAKAIFGQVNDLKNWENWSPWYQRDPDMNIKYGNQTAGKGGHYSWSSEKPETGSGYMEITDSKAHEMITTAVDFGPMGRGTGSWKFEPSEGGSTKVTWGMQPYPAKSFPASVIGSYILAFTNMDPLIGADFEEGLSNLKKVCEEMTPAANIQMVNVYGVDYAIVRKELDMSQISAFLGQSYGEIGAFLGKSGKQPTGMPCGIYYGWDEENHKSDMAAAMPVSARPDMGEPLRKINIGPGEANLYKGMIIYDYYGPYDGSGEAHNGIGKWLEDNGKKQLSPMVEEYVTDPGAEPDTSKWLTRIYYAYE